MLKYKANRSHCKVQFSQNGTKPFWRNGVMGNFRAWERGVCHEMRRISISQGVNRVKKSHRTLLTSFLFEGKKSLIWSNVKCIIFESSMNFYAAKISSQWGAKSAGFIASCSWTWWIYHNPQANCILQILPTYWGQVPSVTRVSMNQAQETDV